MTKEYKRFAEFCNACQKENYIGLCYGPAGVGKSRSAHYFANWEQAQAEMNALHAHYERYTKAAFQPSLNMENLSCVVYTPRVSNTPKELDHDIHYLMRLFNGLKEQYLSGKCSYWDDTLIHYVDTLIIDEADRLSPKSLEQVRALYDGEYRQLFQGSKPLTVILIGMPGIEKRLARFPQLYSRIGFAHAFKALTDDEIRFIMQNHCQTLGITVNIQDFTDQEAIAATARITQGNFRLIERLLKQALRIMQVNQLSSISKEVIEAARECLVIGNTY